MLRCWWCSRAFEALLKVVMTARDPDSDEGYVVRRVLACRPCLKARVVGA
jgi:hypothetical protein